MTGWQGKRRSIRALRRRRDRTRIDGFDQPSSHRAEERIERRPARPVALAVDSTLAIIGVVGFLFIPWLTQRVSSRLNAVTVFTTLLFWGWLWGVWGLLLMVPIVMTINAVCNRLDGLRRISAFLTYKPIPRKRAARSINFAK